MSELFYSRYHNAHTIIICQAHLGGGDTWITLRGTGDRLSNKFQLIGIVQNRLVQVNDWVPLAVAQHLQDSIDEAFNSYAEVGSYAHKESMENPEGFGPDNWGRMLENGPIGLLPDTFSKAFNIPDRLLDKTFPRRYFVAHRRDELNKLIAEQRATEPTT